MNRASGMWWQRHVRIEIKCDYLQVYIYIYIYIRVYQLYGPLRPIESIALLTSTPSITNWEMLISTTYNKHVSVYLRRIDTLFFNFPLYLQSVPIHSTNVVKACRRVLTSTLIYIIGSESSCDLGNVTCKLNHKNDVYNYNNYVLNLVGRSIGKCLLNHNSDQRGMKWREGGENCIMRSFVICTLRQV
jgi:hypothetical protein